jgi:hypothetical protein
MFVKKKFSLETQQLWINDNTLCKPDDTGFMCIDYTLIEFAFFSETNLHFFANLEFYVCCDFLL